mmetsp:Transcript_22968/g.64086  ORF Transcript_22968/g.64086 Transcript_22968/m.64086 type:complete len:223 (+) Transcript_22968:2-670(+)
MILSTRSSRLRASSVAEASSAPRSGISLATSRSRSWQSAMFSPVVVIVVSYFHGSLASICRVNHRRSRSGGCMVVRSCGRSPGSSNRVTSTRGSNARASVALNMVAARRSLGSSSGSPSAAASAQVSPAPASSDSPRSNPNVCSASGLSGRPGGLAVKTAARNGMSTSGLPRNTSSSFSRLPAALVGARQSRQRCTAAARCSALPSSSGQRDAGSMMFVSRA